uniref:Major sperm protein n=1 Tax=Haemonchus contortus TaxID=6289 RepID=A0A7I4YD58_HAECO
MSRVNVNALKDIKELKEAGQEQQTQQVQPSYIKQPTTTPETPSRLTTVNPLTVSFDGALGTQCQKTLSVANASNDRIAWRILTNAPTRYVVSPNKGFLFKQEKAEVQIILLNVSKYHRRHAFVVQAKPAKMEENNRKLAWRDLAPTDTKLVQSTRISTSCPAATRHVSVTSSGSSVSHSSDKETSANSSRSPSTSSSVVSNIDHGEYTPKIKELTEAVKQAAEQKQLNTQRMVAAVNEVKKLEVELDRAGQNLSQVQQRHSEQDATVTMLRSRLKKVREQLAIAREAERQRNQN